MNFITSISSGFPWDKFSQNFINGSLCQGIILIHLLWAIQSYWLVIAIPSGNPVIHQVSASHCKLLQLYQAQSQANLQKCFISYHLHCKKKNAPGELVKLFFALLKRSITFYFKCYLHINCSVNLNWNNTQLYSSAKPLHNVPSSVFLFANFYFLPCLCRTSIQVWKKNWFCYVHKWIAKKEMLAKTSKCLCWNLLIGAAAQTRAVCKDHEILITLKRCGKFLDLDLQCKISIVLWLFYLLKHFSFIWRHCK